MLTKTPRGRQQERWQLHLNSYYRNNNKNHASKKWLIVGLGLCGILFWRYFVQYRRILHVVLSAVEETSEWKSLQRQFVVVQQQPSSSSSSSSSTNNNSNATNTIIATNSSTRRPRFVTVLLPSVVNEKGVGKRLQAIHETWGPKAKAIFVLTDMTAYPAAANLVLLNHINQEAEKTNINAASTAASNNNNNNNNSTYPQVLLLPPNLSENDVPRLIYIIQQIHQLVDPDFAFLANDHTFVIPEHLCAYLDEHHLDPSHDLYAGRALQTRDSIFNSGAAGYLLSRSTMAKLVQQWNAGATSTTTTTTNSDANTNNYCAVVRPDQTTTTDEAVVSSRQVRYLQKSPGLYLTACLQKGLNITAIDTRDRHKRQHRFHAFPLTRVVAGTWDDWYTEKHTLKAAQTMGTDTSYATLLAGEECCAATTATFHYVEDVEARALFAVRTKLLETGTAMSDAQLKDYMISVWPTTGLGRSQKLPHVDNDQQWDPLVRTIRKISLKKTEQTC